MEYKRKRLIRAALQKPKPKESSWRGRRNQQQIPSSRHRKNTPRRLFLKKPYTRQRTCKARRWTQDESATVSFGFYRKSASVCQPRTLPSPLKQRMSLWRRALTGEKSASVSAFGKGRWISERSKFQIPTMKKCRR